MEVKLKFYFNKKEIQPQFCGFFYVINREFFIKEL